MSHILGVDDIRVFCHGDAKEPATNGELRLRGALKLVVGKWVVNYFVS